MVKSFLIFQSFKGYVDEQVLEMIPNFILACFPQNMVDKMSGPLIGVLV